MAWGGGIPASFLSPLPFLISLNQLLNQLFRSYYTLIVHTELKVLSDHSHLNKHCLPLATQTDTQTPQFLG